MLKKAAWALYDGKDLDILVGGITGFVDILETLYPAETARRRLAEMEIEEVDDELSLLTLQEATAGVDRVSAEAVAQKVEKIAGRNYAKDIRSDETVRVRVGNEWGETVLTRGMTISDRTENVADSVAATGASVVHIGNSYGGRSVSDNRFN